MSLKLPQHNTLIRYGSAKVSNKTKLVDVKDKISPSQRFTKKMPERAAVAFLVRLVPAQDGPFFYTRSHLSALQNCAVLFSTNF